MLARRSLAKFGLTLSLLTLSPVVAMAQTTILNASYDVSRELYKEINPAFAAAYKKDKGADVVVNQSHGGSTKQAQAVANGLEADVVTFNQSTDLDFLADKGVVAKDWKTKFPNEAAPYTTTTVFIVRKGNPKGIKDWSDLVKEGASVVIPNPKTSGNGRYTYLAAWGYALETEKSDDKAKEFVSKLFANVPVFDGGGRGATTTFTQRDVGDVLVTFENEIGLLKAEFGDKFDIVYPSLSIEAAPPVAVVETVTRKARHRRKWPRPTSISCTRPKGRRSLPSTASVRATKQHSRKQSCRPSRPSGSRTSSGPGLKRRRSISPMAASTIRSRPRRRTSKTAARSLGPRLSDARAGLHRTGPFGFGGADAVLLFFVLSGARRLPARRPRNRL